MLSDRGSHIEVVIGSTALCHPHLSHLVSEALARFGRKPMLLVCDGPAQSVELIQAYYNGLRLATIASARIAIVLGGREPTEADRFMDLAATNRGTPVRSFRDLTTAKAWLASPESTDARCYPG